MAESPFPRIGDYGFLSDCHTSALVAPNGAVEWLRLPASTPRASSPRSSTAPRVLSLRPAYLAVPLARRYVPGTKILRDHLDDRAAAGSWSATPSRSPSGPTPTHLHDRPPSTHETEQTLLRSAGCIQGEVDLEIVCDLLYGYGVDAAEWSLGSDAPMTATASGGDPGLRLISDTDLKLDGGRVSARHSLKAGEGCFCALAWGDSDDDPRELRRGQRAAPGHVGLLARVARGRALSGPSVACPPAALGAGAQGAHLRAHRCAPRGLPRPRFQRRREASATGTTATAGFATRPSRCGRCTRSGFDLEARDYVGFVRDICHVGEERLQIMYGIGGERDLPESTLDHLGGLRAAQSPCASATPPTASARTTSTAPDRLRLHSHQERRPPARPGDWGVVGDNVEERGAVWSRARPGHLGGPGEPKHYTSSKIHVLGRARSRREDRESGARRRPSARSAGRTSRTRSRPTSSPRGCARTSLRQHYDTDALDASVLLAPLVRFLPADHERDRRDRQRDRPRG